MLMDNHMQKQMGSVLTFLTHYPDEGDEFLDSTVAGDETSVYHHIQILPKYKFQNIDFS